MGVNMVRAVARHLLAFSLMTLSVHAVAQGSQVLDVLGGKRFPHALKLKDLEGRWYKVDVGNPSASGDMLMSIYAASKGRPARGNRYFTQGSTARIGNAQYLVAYRLPGQDPDPAEILGGEFGMARKESGPPAEITPDTELRLTLLNLQMVSSIGDIEPYDMKVEMEAANKLRAQLSRTTSVSNLKQVSLGILMYVQDYDEIYPPLRDAKQTKELVMPYIKNEQVFLDPATKQPYGMNLDLSYRAQAEIERPAETVVLFETSPGPDGMRAVAFGDGHVKRIPESEWAPMEADMKRKWPEREKYIADMLAREKRPPPKPAAKPKPGTPGSKPKPKGSRSHKGA
jgi:hypothetical protein